MDRFWRSKEEGELDRFWRSKEEGELRRWRLSHGAVFLTMALLSLFILGFLTLDGWEFIKAISVTHRAITNPDGPQSKPQGSSLSVQPKKVGS
jgi:hypothetical protein